MNALRPRNTISGVSHHASDRLVCPNEGRRSTDSCGPRTALSAGTGVLGWDISVNAKVPRRRNLPRPLSRFIIAELHTSARRQAFYEMRREVYPMANTP